MKIDSIMNQLKLYQPHANVMSSLGSLPTRLASAIQRKGGTQAFARTVSLVHYQDYQNCTRLADVAQWLASQACDNLPFSSGSSDPQAYTKFVKAQSLDPPRFPN